MLFPKKTKHRKWQTGRKSLEKRSKPDTRGTTVAFGEFGLQATSPARVTSAQIESARKAMVRALTKAGKYWIRIFPDKPITAKAAEVGMGKGKGDLKYYCFEVRPGRIAFEVSGVDEKTMREALRKAGTKLPCTTKVVSKEEVAKKK
jgi:large subunit ribosomal protein L16